MVSNYIRLGEALEIMDQMDDQGKPVPFQIKFVTANRIKQTGGEIIEIPNARKCSGVRNGKPVFDQREKQPSHGIVDSRDPLHWVNQTRNLLLPNGQFRKIHIRLILEVNHRKVCY